MFSLFNRKKDIFIAVDETGNLGDCTDGVYYVVEGCEVNDRERFANATRRYHSERELKFNTHPQLREKVLKELGPTVDVVYYVQYKKPIHPHGKRVQNAIHRRMVEKISDMVLDNEDYDEFLIEVDHNDRIEDHIVKDIFERNEFGRGRIVKCYITDSKNSHELQSNDFVVGALGRSINRNDDRYKDMIKVRFKRGFIKE